MQHFIFEYRYYGMYPDQRRSSTSSNASSTNMPPNIKEEPQSPSQQAHAPSQNQQHREQREKERNEHGQPKNLKSSAHNSGQQQKQISKNDIKSEEKDVPKVKQEGQKPTMETQGPPPPPTSQYYIHPPYISPGPFGFEPPAHTMYRNMMVPSAYNASPYHLQMSRFHAPEDLSRNTNSKALDILQHHANQFYNPHKIHELSERALKSPTSKASPSVTQSQHQQSQPPSSQPPSAQPPTREMLTPSSKDIRDEKFIGYNESPNSLNLQAPPPTSLAPGSTAPSGQPKVGPIGSGSSSDTGGNGSSPPPQRHIHT